MLFIHVKPLGLAGAARLLDQLTTCWTLLLSGKVGDLYSKKTGEVMSNLKKKAQWKKTILIGLRLDIA